MLRRHWPFIGLSDDCLVELTEVFRPIVYTPSMEVVGAISGCDCGFIVAAGEVTFMYEDGAGMPMVRRCRLTSG